MIREPAISVLMPVHNGAAYVGVAIESILRQEFEDFELLIVDDASTDATSSIVRQVDDTRVRILRNSVQQGVTISLARAAGVARAELLARMDADDIALPQRFARQFSHLQRHPDVAVLGTQAWLVDPTGRVYWKTRAYANIHATRWQLFFGSPIVHSSAMIRRAAFEQLSGYDTRLPYAQDYDLWWRMSRKYEIANLTVPLLGFRVHAQSVSTRRAAEQEAISRTVMRTALETSLAQPITDDETAAILDASQRRRSISNRALARIIQLIRASMASSVADAPRAEDRLAVRRAASDRLLDLVLAYGRTRPRVGLRASVEASRCWPPALLVRGAAGVRTHFEIRARNLLQR